MSTSLWIFSVGLHALSALAGVNLSTPFQNIFPPRKPLKHTHAQNHLRDEQKRIKIVKNNLTDFEDRKIPLASFALRCQGFNDAGPLLEERQDGVILSSQPSTLNDSSWHHERPEISRTNRLPGICGDVQTPVVENLRLTPAQITPNLNSQPLVTPKSMKAKWHGLNNKVTKTQRRLTRMARISANVFETRSHSGWRTANHTKHANRFSRGRTSFCVISE